MMCFVELITLRKEKKNYGELKKLRRSLLLLNDNVLMIAVNTAHLIKIFCSLPGLPILKL